MNCHLRQTKWFSSFLLAAAFIVAMPDEVRSQDSLVPPVVVELGWEIELVLAEPDIATPVMCVFDSQGALLVIESHTHFPPENYAGPDHDRILRLSDSNQDGTLDRREVFFDQGKFTMGLAVLDDGWIAVSHRDDIIKIRDTDGDGKADETVTLATLDTQANYPHNGLSGLAANSDGWVYFGQGENFGEDYTLVAADGSKQVGGGEGGNVFRVRTDGSQLERVATGFWNPFGMCFDSENRLWSAGNDPDAMPPCRLMHVVPGGDFGFEFQFGRGGTHPLQSWLGELPGTLPPAAGTGEAPCAVVPIGDRLWVASWGDNRIEAYRLTPDGATLTSQTETILQGDTLFRPVGIAVAPDKSVYITDWVRRDYSVHQTGRIWRLKPTAGQPVTAAQPPLSDDEKSAVAADAQNKIDELLELASTTDRYLAQAAVTKLSLLEELPAAVSLNEFSSQASLAVLMAWRWRELCNPSSVSEAQRQALITWGLSSNDQACTLFSLRWAAERKETALLSKIENVLSLPKLSPQLFEVTVATISYVKNGTARSGVRDPARETLLYTLAKNSARAADLRALAVQGIPAAADHPTNQELSEWLAPNVGDTLQREIIRLLIDRCVSADAEHQAVRTSAVQTLQSIAADMQFPISVRADAVSGLASVARDHQKFLSKLNDDRAIPNEIREEAQRVLSSIAGIPNQKRPPVEDLDSWLQLVGKGGDAEAGARVFQRSTCIKCHLHEGRGAMTGPDLTSLAGQTRERILKSILYPSSEIGPLYVPWKIVTVDGDVKIGLKMPTPGVGGSIAFQASDGTPFYVKLEDIEFHSFSRQSIMPNGLEQTMSIGELRDLLAFLAPDTSE
ncbi:PVC-type heme-binding CxxCH protein [Rhodopirellula sp. MGV]|uniref:PVC-type heme-binding CxxCH protein n=1 Tax=Rhodopirellula sp. MGV TaxID=2023130 RepID=UPI000B95E64F|nr:PVC-type heme-binding CxxCH protein [Rhodopirellula sp. MGV]OYP35816.1 hypothetical protein CGZ80_10480 [Rhodopirellula sp. MGV]PNY36371.1 hypothetical protein C2E31_13130 [Rhodopirellula baltica]